MPNVREMETRLASHLARVSVKAMEKEAERIHRLAGAGKISQVTRIHLLSSSAIRLAWRANAS